MLANQLLYIQGIYLGTANIASLFQPATPIWTAVLVFLFRVEALPDIRTAAGLANIFGILGVHLYFIILTLILRDLTLQGLVGAVVVNLTTPADSKTADNLFAATMCLLGNTAAMAMYVVIQKVELYYITLLANLTAVITCL